MKSSVFLAISLAANVACGAVLLVRFFGEKTPAPETRTAVGAPFSPGARAATLPPVDPETWRRLDRADPAGLVARLREGGYPPALRRAIVDALVRERFAARHRALAEAEGAQPYWRGGFAGMFASDPKLKAERRALHHEEEALRQELLGPEANEISADALATLRQRFGDFPREKLVQLQKINADYNEMTAESRDESGDILLPEDRARLALLQRERDADIARLLTPQEKIEYEYRHSTTANRLRSQLSAFNPTEEEYRALFTLNRAVDVAYGNPNTLSPEERRQRNNAQKQLASQIETALGPARFAEYQQAIDPAYQEVHRLVTRLELPPSTTAQVIAVQKDISQRTAALRSDRTLDAAQRQTRLTALGDEAAVKLSVALGQEGLKAYKASQGYWLQELQRPPAPATRPQP